MKTLRKMKAGWQVYLLLLLPILYLIIFCYVPMGGLVLAFKDYDLSLGIWKSKWVGFANFVKFFKSYKFTVVLRNTLVLAIYSLLAGFPIPIKFALFLNVFPGVNKYKKIVSRQSYIFRISSRRL